MKIWQHILMSVILFFVYVWMAQAIYLYMFQHACQDAGGTYQDGYHLCSGLVNPEPDYGAHASYLRWVMILGIPAVLLTALQVSAHALVVALNRRSRRRRGRSRKRVYRSPN